MQTIFKRIIEGTEKEAGIVLYDRTKASQAEISNIFLVGKILEPVIVKLTDEDCWLLYKGNEWISAVVNRIARDCRKVPVVVRPKDKNKKVKGRIAQRISQVVKFLENPNNNKEAFFDIREKTIKDMLVYGRGCVEKVVNKRTRQVEEIYSLDSPYIKMCGDEHGTLPDTNAYHADYNHNEVDWDIDEMIMMILDPNNKTIYGTKILDAIANAVAADILRANFNANYFINGAEANGIIGLEGMNNRELQKFRQYWKENFKGASNAHKTAAINVPIQYIRMAITNRDLQFSEYGIELRTKIFANYGMLPFIMGIVDQNTGKLNSSEQVELYKESALRPILTREAFYYTSEIIQMGFGYNDIEVAFPSLDLIDTKTQAEIDRLDAGTGIVVVNEIRAKRGLGDVPWGNTPISVLPGGGQVDPNTGRLIPPSQQNNKPKPQPRKIFDHYIKIIQHKFDVLNSIIKYDEEYKKNLEKLVEQTKVTNVVINGKVFETKIYTLPVEIKNHNFDNYVRECVNTEHIEDIDALPEGFRRYLQAVGTHIGFIYYMAIKSGTLNNLKSEIDKLVCSEEQTELFDEIS